MMSRKDPLNSHSIELLIVQDLEVSFNGFKAVNGLNLTINRGEVHVLIGANGAGKTTTMDLISGKTKTSKGSVRFKGKNITNRMPHQIARAGIGRKFQVPSIFRDLTVAENMEVALCKNHSISANLRYLYHRSRSSWITELLGKVGLEKVNNETARYLSHGQTQWLELGMILAQNPELILLDEPTAGMTSQETLKTAEIINSLKGQHALLVVEHDMSFVRDICETITVMHQGKKLAAGTVSEVENNPAVIEAYLGSGSISHA